MPCTDRIKRNRYQLNWMKQRRKKAIELKGGMCIACSSKRKLEFHHRDPEQKEDHRIWSWAWERILIEIAKCDLLCEKCHLKETRRQAEIMAIQLPREENGRFQTVAA